MPTLPKFLIGVLLAGSLLIGGDIASPQAPAEPVIETPCYEDEIGVVMRYDFQPAVTDRGYHDGDRFYRLCIPQDDYDEALIDAYIDSH